jgi:hypothetical protein
MYAPLTTKDAVQKFLILLKGCKDLVCGARNRTLHLLSSVTASYTRRLTVELRFITNDPLPTMRYPHIKSSLVNAQAVFRDAAKLGLLTY